ncbi:ATP-binding protein [Micromonospora globbae]|uniref:ATP-binding protein n=1 Tax=Micromonospora globbae TaxID=1894969 RepID=UPI0034240075
MKGTEPASRAEADAQLRDGAERLVRAQLMTREDQDFARSQKSMIGQTMREYGGRFLFELIQNGYDAQPPDAGSGRIAVVLARGEGTHGTLYVANTGRGFTASNARRIPLLGLSDKPIGEGIGNKGVGFKSVLQICATPEVYSTLDNGDPGFCFRFATEDDVPGLVGADPVLTRQIIDEVSLYSITLPAEGTPARVAALWADGYATVVRLPLDEGAVEAVAERLDELEASEVPLMLFLKRLERVTIRREDGSASEERVLTRVRGSAPVLAGDFTCDLVTLDEDGTYLVLSRRVDPAAYRRAVQEAIDRRQLDPRYAESTASVEVSVAVPYAAADAHVGRCYTFLPMGRKAPSPFAGHLNAPFFTDLSRTDIDETNALNRLLLTSAAELCLDAAEALTSWLDDAAPAAVLDLLCWDDERLGLLTSRAEEQGRPLGERPLLPAQVPGRWLTPAAAWRWPVPDTGMLTAAFATAASGAEFLRELPTRRQARLRSLLSRLGLDVTPEPERLAGWVEQMMAVMQRDRRPISDWDQAYADIARLFEKAPEALRARRILLTDSDELARCAGRRTGETPASREAAPFFPPTTQRIADEDDVDPGADLSLPASLSNRLFYLHGELTWHVNRQQTPARKFLQENRLVRGFETRGILEHIRAVLADSRAQRVARDALTFVFNLSRSGARIKTDLAALGLRLPTANGAWMVAEDCLFSSDWPGTTGKELSAIAATLEDRSAELYSLAGRLLASPAQVMRAGDRVTDWVVFLRRIGVREVLPLSSVQDSREINGRELTRDRLTAVRGLPEPVRDQWAKVLPTTSPAWYPSTPYVAKSPLWWMPGQADWKRLTDRVRQHLARQILRGLKGAWPADALATVWERNRPGDKNPQKRCTPLGAFLRTVAWMPTQRPGQSGGAFATPADCWTFPVRSDDLPPRFATLLTKPMRDLLDDDTMALRRLTELGLGVWGRDGDAPRLVRHLGALFHTGAVTEMHAAQFHNTYRAAWAACAGRGTEAEPFPPDTRGYLVVDIGGSSTALPLEPAAGDQEPPDVVVASRDDEQSLLRLMADFGWRVLEVDAHPETVTAILRRRLGDRVSRASGVTPVVLLDGDEFGPPAVASARPIVGILPWLPLFVATLLEHQRSHFTRLGQRAFDDALDALRRVRVAFAGTVEVRLGEETRRLPDRLHGVLPMPHAAHPTLIVEGGETELDWDMLEAMAEPLAYLVGRRDYARTFRWAAERTRRVGVPLAQLADDDVAEICDVTAEDVRTMARRIQSSLRPLLHRLYPVVAHYLDAESAAPFDPDSPSVESEQEARDRLTALADRLDHEPDELFAVALDAPTLAALQQQLKIPVRELNATLSGMGGRYPLIDYGAQHSEDFADYVRHHRDSLLDRLRWHRWDRFAAGDPQPDWPQLRRVELLAPDPDWGTTVDVLSTDLMAARVEEELTARLGEQPPDSGPPLPRRSDCAKANAELVDTAAGRLAKLVRAWLERHSRPVPAPWTDEASAGPALRATLDSAGALDFAMLTLPDVLRWLQTLGVWPTDMPATDDVDALGLTPDDLDRQKAEERQQRAERERQRRTVHIDDKPFDLDDGFTSLRAALDNSLDRTPAFLATPRRFTGLKETDARSGPGARIAGGGFGGGGFASELSSLQKLGVGFAGEWFAYRWLERQYGADFSPECWVSGYRERVFPGTGDDSLGWDFEVPGRRGTWYYEVKTTLAEGGRIELGETQVIAAQENARNRRWRLLVITNVMNENRQIRMLPNPFDPASRGRYRFVGQGLRLEYRWS